MLHAGHEVADARVRIGPENKRADADAVKAGVKRRFGIDGIVVPSP